MNEWMNEWMNEYKWISVGLLKKNYEALNPLKFKSCMTENENRDTL